MTRGFVTIATGKALYYELAKNLLLSYQLYCDNPYPFAIICDQENEITKLFDNVVLLPDAKRNYFDKFELLIRAPYDETIFIDSDCLAYDDLNQFWEYFSNADDFSASGYNFPIDSQDGLFWEDAIGEYKGKVHWKPSIHGGLYFIRRGATCDSIYAEYQNIMLHRNEYRWPDYCVDEPIFGLAMAAHGCRALEEKTGNYIYPWLTTSLDCDIFSGKCAYQTTNGKSVSHGKMIHWSVRECGKPLYRFEAEKANLLTQYNLRPVKDKISLNFKDTILYKYKVRFFCLQLMYFRDRVVHKFKRLITNHKV